MNSYPWRYIRVQIVQFGVSGEPQDASAWPGRYSLHRIRERYARPSAAVERSEAAAIAAAERDQAATERAAAHAQEAFLERQYERVLTAGQIVEDMFWAIQTFREQGTEAADVPKKSGCHSGTVSVIGWSA
jgi:hypothetical protein